jgi:hypothetical protein
MLAEIPPHLAVSDFVRRVKGRSSHRVQMEFPDLRKRYWGRHFWARGSFSTTSGNITDDVIHLQEHETYRRQPVVIQLLSSRSAAAPRRDHRCGARRRPRPLAARIDPVTRRGKRRFRSEGMRCQGSSRSSFQPGPRIGSEGNWAAPRLRLRRHSS